MIQNILLKIKSFLMFLQIKYVEKKIIIDKILLVKYKKFIGKYRQT